MCTVVRADRIVALENGRAVHRRVLNDITIYR